MFDHEKLVPFSSSLQSWSFTKRFFALASLCIVIGQWSSPVAGASTSEGWVILRPEFTTPQVVLSVIRAGLIQGLGFGAWLARWLAPKSSLNRPNPALDAAATAPGSGLVSCGLTSACALICSARIPVPRKRRGRIRVPVG